MISLLTIGWELVPFFTLMTPVFRVWINLMSNLRYLMSMLKTGHLIITYLQMKLKHRHWDLSQTVNRVRTQLSLLKNFIGNATVGVSSLTFRFTNRLPWYFFTVPWFTVFWFWVYHRSVIFFSKFKRNAYVLLEEANPMNTENCCLKNLTFHLYPPSISWTVFSI